MAERIQYTVAQRDTGVAVEDADTDTPGKLHAVPKQLAFDPACIFNADHDLGKDVFVNTRRCEIIGRADLTQISRDRIRRLRAIQTKTGNMSLRKRIQEVPHPSQR